MLSETTPTRSRASGPTRQEGMVLSWTLIAIYVAFAGLGRDIFYNSLINPTQYDPIGAVLIYVRLGLCFGLLILMSLHLGVLRTLRAAPLAFLPFLAVALASSAWSVSVDETIRSALALTAFYFAVSVIVMRLGMAEVARIILKLAGVIVIASTVLAIAVPSVGVHNASDALQNAHAGRWRGIFQHKNGLGPWGAYAGTMMLFYGGQLRIRPWFRWISCASGLACLIFSGSVTAIVGAATIIAGFALVSLHRRMSPGPLSIAILAMAAVGIYAVQNMMENLLPLVGRDESFTGRTEIWPMAVQYIQTHLFLGSGYFTVGGEGFFALTRAHFNQALGPENSYLASLLDLGLVGFVCFFGAVLWALVKGITALNYLDRPEQAAAKMYMLILMATLTMSVSEATPYVVTGFTGIVNFTALIALLGLKKRSSRSRNWRAQGPVPQGA